MLIDLLKTLASYGVLTVNECRDILGYPPIEGGDIAFVKTEHGAVPVRDLNKHFTEPI